jgi:dihydrofolate reductase/thymidylate synthase
MIKKMKISLIVACDSQYGIGKNNKIPWYISEDLKFFSKITNQHCVVMGKNTWQSLPEGNRGLKNRINLVFSKTMGSINLQKENKTFSETYIVRDMEHLSRIYQTVGCGKKIFVIGGSFIYKEFLKNYSHWIENIYFTRIQKDYQCDVFFPEKEWADFVNQKNIQIITEKINGKTIDKNNGENVDYEITKYSVVHLRLKDEIGCESISRVNKDEMGYLNLLRKILEEDKDGRQTRNGKTFSVFGPELEFDLTENTLPLLTTRKMFLRGIFEELIFFIRGETNTKLLEEKGVNIWKGNTSKEFLKGRGLDYEEGDMGPMYGFQWRHFGAEYKSSEMGYDQLYQLIKGLVEDPHSRRHLLTTYNPSAVEKSVLAPCHGIVVQMYVDGECLDCKMYQRSCDAVLGEPFNITSYALMTHLIAWVCGLKARRLILTFGDVHIYEQHLEGVKEQLKRPPFEFPKLKIKKEWVGNGEKKVEDRIQFLEEMKFDDLEVVGYKSHPGIKFDMIA